MDRLGLSEKCKFSLISALSCCSLGWSILTDFPWWFKPIWQLNPTEVV